MELSVPEELKFGVSKEQSIPGIEFMKCCQSNDILLTRTEPEIPKPEPRGRSNKGSPKVVVPNYGKEGSPYTSLILCSPMYRSGHAKYFHRG